MEFDQHLPHTSSGKVMRRLLKARELGLPEGDLSTLEQRRRRAGPAARPRRRARGAPTPTGTATPAAAADDADPPVRGDLRPLYSETRIRGFLHLYVGEEAVAAGVMSALEDRDAVVSTYREHGHALARGLPMDAVMAEMFGTVDRLQRRPRRLDAPVRRDATVLRRQRHRRRRAARWPSASPSPTGCSTATRVTACFFGDGAVAEGEFHECLNLAALWRLPVLFCCENNLYAMGTAVTAPIAETDVALRAASYGMVAWAVDGMDVDAVRDATRGPWRASGPAAARRSWSCAPTASARTRCTTPSSTATRPRSSGGRSATRSGCSGRGCGTPGSWTTPRPAGWRTRSPPRSPRRSRPPRPAPLEPVEDLTRFVTSPEAPS